MRVVVADTSPLNYLVLIGEIDVLRQLYGEVLIPEAVAHELQDPYAPEAVAKWAASAAWLHVQPTPHYVEPLDKNLDPGEAAAILLAEAQDSPTLLLIDDAYGRAEAERRGLAVTGTLGILRAAAIRKLIDLPGVLARLQATNFRAPDAIISEMLIEWRSGKFRGA